jgi:hypothetical protein
MFIMLITAGRADPIADDAPSAHGCCGAFVSGSISTGRGKTLQNPPRRRVMGFEPGCAYPRPAPLHARV